MPTRRTMDEAYRGGRVEPDEVKPERLRYPCFADGCPMAGSMFPDQVMGEKTRGVCPWHYNLNPSDIPRVTQRLRDWKCVADEIEQARLVFTGPLATDPAGHDESFHEAWRRLAPAVELSGWSNDLKPQDRESYGDWAHRLMYFIGARVLEVLSVRRST